LSLNTEQLYPMLSLPVCCCHFRACVRSSISRPGSTAAISFRRSFPNKETKKNSTNNWKKKERELKLSYFVQLTLSSFLLWFQDRPAKSGKKN
jgi:hypothetical protein